MKSLGRAMDALKLLTDKGREISVAETARHLEVTPGTASRILATMARGRLLDQNPDTRRYSAGALSLQLAANFSRNTDLLEHSEREMAEIAANTGHTTWQGLLSERDVIVLKTVSGTHPIQFSVEPGHRLPAHAAAMGKALLALKTDEEICEFYNEELPRETSETITDPRILAEELRIVRNMGYARSNQELFDGVRAIAIAVQDAHSGKSVALSVSYPTFAVDKDGDQHILEILLSSGKALGLRIGDQRWSNMDIARR